MIDVFADYGVKLDLLGAGSAAIPSMTTVYIDYIVDVDKMITGAEYFCEGNWEDTISFQLLDSNNNLLDQFVTDMHIGKSGVYQFYKAKLEQGQKIRVVYYNEGTNEAKFKYNLICHKDK